MLAPLLMALLSLATPSSAQDREALDGFVNCEDANSKATLAGSQCTRLSVPLSYSEPEKGKIELFVRKFPARGNSKGQLWLIAGGPGESGASLYPFLETIREAAPDFDLLIPDHRGTGFSTRLCPNEESPSSVGGSALAGEEWNICFAFLNAEPERTRAFTISNAAHDLNQVMSRLGTGGRRYLYGVSYGTQLVLRMLAIDAPENLDGVILDSLVPLESSSQLDLSHRSAATDGVGRQVLRDCDAKPQCSKYFPEGAERAVRNVLERDDIEAMLGPNPKYRLGALLDFPETRALLPNVLAGLQAGDPAWFEYASRRLARLGSLFESYPQGGSSIPLVSLISRSENNARPDLTAEMVEQESQRYLFASPLPSLLLASGVPIYEPDASFGTSPGKIPSTIVLQGTLDPKTPHSGAQEHIAVLSTAGDIALVSVDGATHFIVMTAPDEFIRSVRAFIEHGTGAARATFASAPGSSEE
jgi:pimeloyl-ACP methyl ester carboxylesterase